MISVSNIRKINCRDYDEVWAIVRSMRTRKEGIKQVSELSPSWELFKKYLSLKKLGLWNLETFKKDYVPVFIDEMKSVESRKALNRLSTLDIKGKEICLVCYCEDEETCHRSIIAGLLQSVGICVRGVKKDYSFYVDTYF